jgi:hypothetical protein
MTAKDAARRFRLASPATALVAGGLVLALVIADPPLARLAHQSLNSSGGSSPFWFSAAVGAVGFVVASRKPRNPLGWILLASAAFGALSEDASFYVVADYRLRHGGLPFGWVAVLAQPGWAPSVAMAGLGVLLFPDGHLAVSKARASRSGGRRRGGRRATRDPGLPGRGYLEVPPVRDQPDRLPHARVRDRHGPAGGRVRGIVLLATHVVSVKEPVAVAGSTLAVAALFNPLRRRVQRAVDRRFNRARYDTDRLVAAFAVRLKDAVDQDAIQADLAGVVQQALEPAHVTVWMSDR